MAENELEIKERIIKAALEIISKEGIEGVTTRKIASLCGVNIASTNYHFGSKDNLIIAVLNNFFSKIFEIISILDNTELPPIERLRLFLTNYLDHLSLNPGVIRSVFTSAIIKQTISDELRNRIQIIISKLKATFSEFYGIPESPELLIRIFQVMSSIIFPVLIGHNMEKIANISFDNEEIRHAYVNYIISMIIKMKEL